MLTLLRHGDRLFRSLEARYHRDVAVDPSDSPLDCENLEVGTARGIRLELNLQNSTRTRFARETRESSSRKAD